MEETTQQNPGPQQAPAGEDKDVQDNKLIAALAYLWIISIIVLLVKKDSKFAQFHAKQGLILFIASVVAGFIPVLGWFIINPIIWIVALVGLIQALMGKYWKIPLVGDLAAKINL
jgi:uncharacterized membrane protein